MTSLDVLRIINAGGGVGIDCSKFTVLDLVRFANAASSHKDKPHLLFHNVDKLTTLDMVRIANAGSGLVLFDQF